MPVAEPGQSAGAGPQASKIQKQTAQVVTATTDEPEKAAAATHRVKPGETLYSIAKQYGTTVAALRQSNPFLAERSLEAGDMLNVQR